jgi:hypothetical protein
LVSGKKLTLGVVLVALSLVIVLSPYLQDEYRNYQHEQRFVRGQELAGTYCSGCHLEPAPDILPKKSWEVALGYMGYMLGMTNIDYLADHPEFAQENVKSKQRYLAKENMIPAAPLLSEEDWATLRDYFVSAAPEEPLPQTGKPVLQWEMPQFEIVQSDYRADPAVTTMVHIRSESGEAYIGDSLANTIAVLDSDAQLKAPPRKFGRAMSPVGIEFVNDAAYIASIGDIFGDQTSADRVATISRLELLEQNIDDASISVVIDDLHRLAAMDVADMNGDGIVDFVVCGFGTRQGNVSLYLSQNDGSYIEQELISRPGAVTAKFHDFNGDDHLDIAVLLSDALEGLYILTNDGTNQFASTTVFETHPSYGHTLFELQDFNNDGLMDILAVNGDNVDSDPYNTLKNFHGIRVYLNRGDLRFDEAYFFPLYGAFGARAGDFDNDGDMDIAAISFYPDFDIEKRESFVYLQNDGDLNFSAYTTPELVHGRWMTIGVGDLDGDADTDIILGGAYIPTGMFAYMDTYRALAESAPSILVLRNTSR